MKVKEAIKIKIIIIIIIKHLRSSKVVTSSVFKCFFSIYYCFQSFQGLNDEDLCLSY